MDNQIMNIDNIDKPIRQYCLALDFDLTITDVHTGGNIKNSAFYWNSKENLNSIIYQLEKFKNLNFGIYIVTRNIQSNVINYIKLYGFSHLVDRVYGAKNQEHMNEGTGLWSAQKLSYLNEISRLESINKSNIYFFDDTKVNINVAKSNGYNNSHLIEFDYKKNILPSNVLTDKLSSLYNKIQNN
jgi:hypothetical protein